MGKAVEKNHFDNADYLEFRQRLAKETKLLEEYCKSILLSESTEESGFELELWLLDQQLKPACNNIEFIHQINEKYLIPEIAKSSLEMNIPYEALHDYALGNHQLKLQAMLDNCYQQAKINKQPLIFIGSLPSAVADDYTKAALTEKDRYLAMDEYLDMHRDHKPKNIQLKGYENLDIKLNGSALVGAMSSFQIHFRVV